MIRKFLFNQDKCVGCTACAVACKNEFQTPAGIDFRTVRPGTENAAVPERTYVNMSCAHCEDPACLNNCPVKAYTKRTDGIVVHNIKRCIGCKRCTQVCPYASPKYRRDVKKVSKCQFCYQRLDKEMLPSCVEGCPVGALGMMDLVSSRVSTSLGVSKVTNAIDHLPELPSKKITQPNHRFIARKGAKQVRYDGNK